MWLCGTWLLFIQNAKWFLDLQVHPAPYINGKLKQECVDEFIDILKDLTHSSGFRMCLVLAENSCILVEPDGQTKISDDPPSGGVRIKSVGGRVRKKLGRIRL